MTFKEDERIAYNEARKKWLRKYHIKAQDAPGILTKEQVREMTPQQVKSLRKGVFTQKSAKELKTLDVPEGERPTKALKVFENNLYDVANEMRSKLRKERVETMTVSEEGYDMPTTKRSDVLGPRSESYGPYTMIPQTTLPHIKRGTDLLLAEVSDPTKDRRLKENLIRAVMRSSISEEDATVIAEAIRRKSTGEIGELFYKENDFDFSYIYDKDRAREENEERVRVLKKILGVPDDWDPRISKANMDTYKRYAAEGDLIERARLKKAEMYASMTF